MTSLQVISPPKKMVMMLMILMYFLDDFDDGKNNARTLGFPILAATISLPKMTGGVPSAPTDSAPLLATNTAMQ